jgi:hypothetical protein
MKAGAEAKAKGLNSYEGFKLMLSLMQEKKWDDRINQEVGNHPEEYGVDRFLLIKTEKCGVGIIKTTASQDLLIRKKTIDCYKTL